MKPGIKKAALVMAGCFPMLLAAHSVEAQAQALIDPQLSLAARTPPFGGPTISSTAGATLYNATGGQRLTSEVIIGHKVADIDLRAVLYEKRVVSATGNATNQVFINGIVSHCYDSALAAHANVYNVHETIGVGPVCADPYEPPPPPPHPEVPEENCPVLLDLQQDGFHLSGPNPAVSFDIDADGDLDQIAWTRAGEDDAFLCWDRNGNGVIDDGRELFGYSTLLQSGGLAKVGYRALAELDRADWGGNGDGRVDALDRNFRELCAWVDWNRDGISQPAEIRDLEEVGIIALRYFYGTTQLRDSYGNLFRYVSQADMRTPSGGVRPWPTFDVIFGER